jgi:hypothetical protein
MALACSRGSGNSVTIIPRMTAEVIAPPTPWMNLAATSTSWLWASPQASEAMVNTTRPARKTLRREVRSPSRPASSSRPPNAIKYALTTQASPAWENPRSAWIAGRATLTTVASRTIINMPVQSTASAAQRDRASTATSGGRTATATVSHMMSPSVGGPDSWSRPYRPDRARKVIGPGAMSSGRPGGLYVDGWPGHGADLPITRGTA